MAGIISMPVSYIIDGTNLHLCSVASYYCSTVHFNPLAIYEKLYVLQVPDEAAVKMCLQTTLERLAIK